MKISWLPFRSFCKYFHFFFVHREYQLVKKFGIRKPVFQPVFIVGAPRSGSTIFYQVLTNILNVTYVSNLVELCRELPLVGFEIHDRLFDSLPHNSFSSRYGNTQKLKDPCESIMWRKWLIPGRHYILPEEISKEKKEAFRQTVWAVLNRYNRPWVIKNLSFGMRLPLIKEIFPETVIINIKRDVFFNAQSIYLAYKKFGIAENKVWSIRPPDYKEISNLPLEEKVVAQIFLIEKEIEKNLGLFGNNVLNVQFEDFVDRPLFYVDRVKEMIGARDRIKDKQIEVYNSNKIKISSQEEQRILKAIRKYYG